MRHGQCRWRWGHRRISALAGESAKAAEQEVVYLPVKGVEGVSVADAIEIYPHEVEALKLIHLDGLTVEEAAAKFGVSKSTFWRILECCRYKIAQALVSRKPIKLVSDYSEKFCEESSECL